MISIITTFIIIALLFLISALLVYLSLPLGERIDRILEEKFWKEDEKNGTYKQEELKCIEELLKEENRKNGRNNAR